MAADRPLRILATSEVECEKFEFLWTLKNFSSLGSNSKLESPNFRGGNKSNHLWRLELSTKDATEYLSVHLRLVEFGDGDTTEGRKIKIKFKFHLLNEGGMSVYTYGAGTYNKIIEYAKMIAFGWPNFIAKSDLMAPSKGLVANDSLKLLCNIAIIGNVKQEILNDVGLPGKRNVPKDQLSSDFGKLLKDSVLTDFAITTNSSTFTAHKNVLAARSSVFSAMFHATMTEAETNSVKIIDFDDDAVKAMLEYIYTGHTEHLAELATDLFKLADKYDVQGLKEDCGFSIAEHLTVENASDVLVMAHTHNANMLKTHVVDFINRNKQSVKQTKSFQEAVETHGSLLWNLLYFQLN